MKKVLLVCNAHIDPVWLWEKEEGIAEAISTFRIAADFCEREEQFVFNHNEAVLYEWVLEYEPELFERIKKCVKAKKWHIMGGWYLQPDCNMPSGETMLRQIKTGKAFFKKHFGEDFNPKTAINFDSFGHNKGLVQILQNNGYTSYLVCRPSQAKCPLPSDDFTWQGENGSKILVHRDSHGYGNLKGKAVEKIVSIVKDNADDEVIIALWGIGNHGGGPSKEDYEKIKKLMNKEELLIDDTADLSSIAGVDGSKAETLDGKVDIYCDREYINCSIDTYFEDASKYDKFTNVVDKSLTPWGIGCYTSQCRIKQKFRLLESELAVAEKMATSASVNYSDFVYPFDDIKEIEKALLFSTFHDVLPGSSTKPVEDASLRLLDYGLELASRVKSKAFFYLCRGMGFSDRGDSIPILVFNPHPYDITTTICCELQQAEQNWEDQFSNPMIYQGDALIPSQVEKEDSSINLDWRKKVAFTATLKAMEMTKFICKFELLDSRKSSDATVKDGIFRFDNSDMVVEIDTNTGFIKSCVVAGVNHIQSAFVPIVVSDDEDPWGMMVDSFEEKVGTFSIMNRADSLAFGGINENDGRVDSIYKSTTKKLCDTSFSIIEDGDVRTIVEVLLKYNESKICQQYILPKKGAYIEYKSTVWWQEANKMLKLEIPVNYNDTQYIGQGIFSSEQKETNGKEQVAGAWVLATDGINVTAVSNRGTYGSSFKDNTIMMTLLRGAAYSVHPIHNRIYVPKDRINPRIDFGEREFSLRLDFSNDANLLDNIDKISQLYNQNVMAVPFYTSGNGEKAKCIFNIDNKLVTVTGVRCTAVNQTEITLFNSTRSQQTVTLTADNTTDTITLGVNQYIIKTI